MWGSSHVRKNGIAVESINVSKHCTECCAGVNECSRTKLIIVMYMLADSHFKTFFIKLEGSMFIGSTKSTHPF